MTSIAWMTPFEPIGESSCLIPKRFSQGVSSFVSSRWRAKQALIWFPVSIEWRSSAATLIASSIAG
jgi:hypothetical protein